MNRTSSTPFSVSVLQLWSVAVCASMSAGCADITGYDDIRFSHQDAGWTADAAASDASVLQDGGSRDGEVDGTGGDGTVDAAAADGALSEAGVDASTVDGADGAPLCGDLSCSAGETCENCPSDCGCPPGQQCVDGPSGPFCTACDPDACGAFGVGCCPHNAPSQDCTNWFVDPGNCGGCGVQCTSSQACVQGACVDCTPGTGEADCLFKCPYDPMQWWRGTGTRDITFVAFGDPQAVDTTAGCMRDAEYATDQNDLTRAAINSTGAHVWPAGGNFYREGQPYDHVRGVVVAGDLTQAGSESFPAGQQACSEYTIYRNAFGRCGTEGKLRFPLYEGYGNHDYPAYPNPGDPTKHPVIDYLDRITAGYRPGSASDVFDDPYPGTGHYAWRWDDIWFVNVNLKVGTEQEIVEKLGATRDIRPHGPRRFLIDFLQSRSNSSRRQLVLVSHYGVNSARMSLEEKRAFCDVIDQARRGTTPFTGQKLSFQWPILVNLHGHTHNAPTATVSSTSSPDDALHWECPNHPGIDIPRFDLGSPFYLHPKNGPGRLHFTIVRIGGNNVEAVGVSAPSGDPTGPWSYTHQTRLGILNPVN